MKKHEKRKEREDFTQRRKGVEPKVREDAKSLFVKLSYYFHDPRN